MKYESTLRHELATQYKLDAIFNAIEKIAKHNAIDISFAQIEYKSAEDFRNNRTTK